ncbi:hypothetical protein CPIN18021_0350 [Campylobacter pinnipediorum subsp. caledonicus]|uniref:Uncharacterized protein n=1 Tax=Campylobacter pinnipediorum subsp. caledonicus TaxID=1874362 RepID=A0A1S6U690_9BACT|nr:Rha family transcriptional regulator [Campylobacter pinnipediorum]AQW87195.1 hypothetical protein CPIN18021_0350 [Campylobacter pinnipediorum subsp. caledonicus]OPA71869.1 hypothetical protein BB381_06960 [Campylobacter pinnipediorum subsp. caledonicus]
MNNLVINHNGTLATTQSKVSVLTDNSEQSVQRLIREYKTDLEEFGVLEAYKEEVQAGLGYTYKKIYYLNEQQATLLLTYMKNTKKVREAKKILVKAFYELKAENQKLKFDKYINEISSLNAVLIDKAKRHQRVVNAYKSNLSQRKNEITILKNEIAKAKAVNDNSYKALYHNARLERDCYINANERLKAMFADKEKRVFEILQNILKQVDKTYGDIGALVSYVWEDNDYFINQRRLNGAKSNRV